MTSGGGKSMGGEAKTSRCGPHGMYGVCVEGWEREGVAGSAVRRGAVQEHLSHGAAGHVV